MVSERSSYFDCLNSVLLSFFRWFVCCLPFIGNKNEPFFVSPSNSAWLRVLVYFKLLIVIPIRTRCVKNQNEKIPICFCSLLLSNENILELALTLWNSFYQLRVQLNDWCRDIWNGLQKMEKITSQLRPYIFHKKIGKINETTCLSFSKQILVYENMKHRFESKWFALQSYRGFVFLI